MKNTTSYGFVYLIACQGINRVKIGYSADPNKRLKELSTGAPGQLVLLATWRGTQKHEAMLHKRLDKYRSQLEWFEIDAHLAMQHVTKMMAGDCPIVPTTKEIELAAKVDQLIAAHNQKLSEMESRFQEASAEIERLRGIGRNYLEKGLALSDRFEKYKRGARAGSWYSLAMVIVASVAMFIFGMLYADYKAQRIERPQTVNGPSLTPTPGQGVAKRKIQ